MGVDNDKLIVAFDKDITTGKRINLLDLTRQQLRQFLIFIGEKAFHADQIMKWIYHFGHNDFDKMTDVSKKLRSRLKAVAKIAAPDIVAEHRSKDGTIKWALSVDHDQQIETVYIPEGDRATLCVSSQVGCALACRFCSTGRQGFSRNLRVSEIIGQVWRASGIVASQVPIGRKPITNIVLMGMGEPLLNIANVVPALEIMLDDFGYGLSKRRVTLSTSGVAPGIDKLAGMIDVALAISLHAPNDDLRNKIMPINQKYNISTLLTSIRRYLSVSNANRGKVTIEYVLLSEVNDEVKHAEALARLLKSVPCKINLIPWNSFPDAPYRSVSKSRMNDFMKILVDNGFTVTIRKTRGSDIDAACGQLAGDIIDRTKHNQLFSTP